MKQAEELMQFISKLVEEKGLSPIESTALEAVKNDLYERLEDRINMSILSHMPKDKADVFEKMLYDGSDEELQKFTQDAIPDLSEIIASEMLNFRKLYLNL